MDKLPNKLVPEIHKDDWADWFRIIAGDRPPRREHKWDADGERCVICGDKDWMQTQCRGPSDQASGEHRD